MDERVFTKLIVVLICWIQCNYATSTTTIVNMDKRSSPECGKVVVLDPSHEVRLLSKGLAPNGYCGVSVFTPREKDGYTCDAICFKYKKASISTCEVKVKLIGHKFRKAGDLVEEYNCHQTDKDAQCWNVGSLRLEVIETYNYAYVSQKPLYEFDIDVSARCTKDKVIGQSEAYYASKSGSEKDEHQTYVEGIAVGISLACVFLIVLFIAWCYTKHQAVSSGPSSSSDRSSRPSSSNTHKKGNIISTFRKKLHIRRKSAQSSDEPEAVYRKTDTSAEAQIPSRDSDATIPLTKESDHETFELANETLAEGDKNDQASEKHGGEDSPKDGGAEGSKLEPPEVVIVPGTPEPPEGSDD
ncbi:uncharacterized protein LOC123529122 [Mercenaria mercenaria]|uniref:uncharacterized protein LOC123529122 n=1 Tax=Mercenaria mercenaria TaxID=6596 RepID=UPI00234E4940|nr:uncharacterized protein LOC123529122 [Mercenaria mercenaria]